VVWTSALSLHIIQSQDNKPFQLENRRGLRQSLFGADKTAVKKAITTLAIIFFILVIFPL
jgi:hypothetical protein